MFIVEGGLVYLDSPIDGGFTAYEDEFSALEFCCNYYREAGLDEKLMDALIRYRDSFWQGFSLTHRPLVAVKRPFPKEVLDKLKGR